MTEHLMYQVMCKQHGRDPEPYTGHKWSLDQELEAQEELWDAIHDEMMESAWIREVIVYD